MQLQSGDVVVVTSIAPNTRSVGDAAIAAAQGGLPLIAITDTLAFARADGARWNDGRCRSRCRKSIRE